MTTVKQKDISRRALEVLSEMRVDGNLVLAYPMQLDRKLYLEVDEVLRSLGGKWKKGSKTKSGAHVFSEDPAERLAAVIATGNFTCPKLNDFFPTPEWLAASMVQAAEIMPGHTVLEPSAGAGALVKEVLHQQPAAQAVTAVDVMPENGAKLLALVRPQDHVQVGDFLWLYDDAEALHIAFDRVVMNPPFSKRQDVVHVLRAYELLKPQGRLVAVMSAGVTFRGDNKALELRTLIDAAGTIEPLPPGSFKDAGTMVNTVLVMLRKN